MKSKISIPNPCSEDWNKMTPTEKGAFCDKCAFEVLDFTDQSPEEIRDTLKARTGQKTCGHISKTQMEIVNTNYHLWEDQTVPQFRSKFLYACIMVFGMTLFTACSTNEDEQKVGMMEHEEYEVGDIEDVGMIQEDTTYECDILEGDIEFEEEDNEGSYTIDSEVKGRMEYEED